MLDTYGHKIGYSIIQLLSVQHTLNLMRNGHLAFNSELWEDAVSRLIEILNTADRNIADLPLELTKVKIKTILNSLRAGRHMRNLENTLYEIAAIRERMLDELKELKFNHVSEQQLEYYENSDFFSQLTVKLPGIASDCSEAGNCIALERYTASVFHLMRVMELCVVELGNKLGVRNATEKTWGALTTEMEQALRARYSRNPTQSDKTEQASYSVLLSHLNAVRIAWRNPTMHPKSSYTSEEARDIFQHVRLFARDLAEIL